jgi:patatin-like phospholipase/acyl hydrolase
MATSAAPTLFATHSSRDFADMADGGLCANNPALLGVVGAFRFNRNSRRGVAPPHDLGGDCLDRLAVLSVGTGEQCAMPYNLESLRSAGTLAWGAHYHNISMESQAKLVHLLAEGLLGGAYRRINPRLDFPMALDDTRSVAALKNLSEVPAEDAAFLRTHLAAPWSV